MRKLLLLTIVFSASLFASDTDERSMRTQKQIQKEIQKEQKYAQEQTFYQTKDYDFKSAEVNPDSIDSIPDSEMDDFDMDDVY